MMHAYPKISPPSWEQISPFKLRYPGIPPLSGPAVQ